MSWLLDHLPWYVLPAIGGAALLLGFFALRAFGFTAKQTWTVMGGGLAAIFAATVYQRGRNAGVASAEARRKAADQAAVAKADQIDEAISGRTNDENRKRLSKWAR